MHIPRLFCMNCNTEMVIVRTGMLLETIAKWGSYYKVYSDVMMCPGCGSQVAIPAQTCLSHNGRAGYTGIEADEKVTFSDNFEGPPEWKNRTTQST